LGGKDFRRGKGGRERICHNISNRGVGGSGPGKKTIWRGHDAVGETRREGYRLLASAVQKRLGGTVKGKVSLSSELISY